MPIFDFLDYIFIKKQPKFIENYAKKYKRDERENFATHAYNNYSIAELKQLMTEPSEVPESQCEYDCVVFFLTIPEWLDALEAALLTKMETGDFECDLEGYVEENWEDDE